MMTEKLKILQKYKSVPDWLNSPLWSAKPTPITEDVDQYEMEVIDDGENDMIIERSNASTSADDKYEEEKTTEEAKTGKKSTNLVEKSCCSWTDSSLIAEKIDRFSVELSQKVMNMRELQLLASEGIPDSGGLRATVWKVLLCYLPKDRDLWKRVLDRKRSKYTFLKQELLVNPSLFLGQSEVTRKMERNTHITVEDSNDGRLLLTRHEIPHGDHPLSFGETSVWNRFFQDTEIAEQIDRDVKRTHPDMPFFSGDSPSSLENQEAIKRILVIFAKLNRSVQYVQGMNEVLAPLYYVFKTDPNETNAGNAEADAFHCFVELLSNFLDHFCQKLDNTSVGIRSTMVRMTELLKKHDEELWRHLDATTKVNPHFYAFRWITLLLTQEFRFHDCLRIWDSLLSNSDGPSEILLRICCAMLICVRSRLLAGDFTLNLKLLQHYPPVDINHLLHVADQLKEN